MYLSMMVTAQLPRVPRMLMEFGRCLKRCLNFKNVYPQAIPLLTHMPPKPPKKPSASLPVVGERKSSRSIKKTVEMRDFIGENPPRPAPETERTLKKSAKKTATVGLGNIFVCRQCSLHLPSSQTEPKPLLKTPAPPSHPLVPPPLDSQPLQPDHSAESTTLANKEKAPERSVPEFTELDGCILEDTVPISPDLTSRLESHYDTEDSSKVGRGVPPSRADHLLAAYRAASNPGPSTHTSSAQVPYRSFSQPPQEHTQDTDSSIDTQELEPPAMRRRRLSSPERYSEDLSESDYVDPPPGLPDSPSTDSEDEIQVNEIELPSPNEAVSSSDDAPAIPPKARRRRRRRRTSSLHDPNVEYVDGTGGSQREPGRAQPQGVQPAGEPSQATSRGRADIEEMFIWHADKSKTCKHCK